MTERAGSVDSLKVFGVGSGRLRRKFIALLLAGLKTFLRLLGIFQVLFGGVVVTLVAGEFRTSLLDFKILGRFVLFSIDLLDLIGVPDLGGLHDFLEKADAIVAILNQGEV